MSNPWDPQPTPARGDPDIDITFAGVGRVLTQWEDIEVRLSEIYSFFRGKPQEASAIFEYGVPRIFADRMTALEQAAERHFIKSPNQTDEGDFSRIARTARGFSLRRNEVAHGVVRPIQWVMQLRRLMPEPPHQFEYLLVPPHFNPRNFDPVTNWPGFVYARDELQNLEIALLEFGHEIMTLRDRLNPP